MRIAAIAAAAIMLTACARLSRSDRPRAGPTTPIVGSVVESRTLSLDATLDATSITVTNRNDFDWDRCSAQLNTTIPEREPWEYPGSGSLRIVRGQSVILRLSAFERDEGARIATLDPKELHALRGKKLIFQCEDPPEALAQVEFGRLIEEPPTGPGVEIGVPYPYELYTHCGVLGARFDGREWDAHPPLSDGQGNPPRGWGNPFDSGTMTLVEEDVAVFTSESGEEARFRPRPQGNPGPPACL